MFALETLKASTHKKTTLHSQIATRILKNLAKVSFLAGSCGSSQNPNATSEYKSQKRCFLRLGNRTFLYTLPR
jgi:hypothetical protein